MNTKKDFIRAVVIIKEFRDLGIGNHFLNDADLLTDAFIRFFRTDNPKFDEQRFKEAVLK